MTDSTTPLTALCNICHSAPPKYTCPRDQVRTCSLPCSQSHKRRAACSGIRDPTSYIPKSVLSTSSGIDRDYNYLSSIERNLDTAEKDTEARGIAGGNGASRGNNSFEKRWAEKGPLGRYLRENGIDVVRAPRGMSRQKLNETRWIGKSKRVVWSVEWVLVGHDGGDGREKRVTEVDEKMSVRKAYEEMSWEKEKERKKRKRGDDEVQLQGKTKVRVGETGKVQDTREEGTVGSTKSKTDQSQSEDKEVTTTATTREHLDTAKDDDVPSKPEDDPTQIPQTPTFYLHKPHTSSRSTVLIPLDPSLSLTTSLSRKSVLEFPTIYVFNIPTKSSNDSSATSTTDEASNTPTAQQQLPPGFITKSQYHQEKSSEAKDLDMLINALPKDQREAISNSAIANGMEGEKEGDWDEGKVLLDVLKRDVDALEKMVEK